MSYTVSACCLREIVRDVGLEYPLGGNTWAIPYKIERCSSCGRDIDDVGKTEVCEDCGLEGCEGDCYQTELEVEEDGINAYAAW